MSEPRHLDEKSLAALMENPAADPELLAHLGTSCAQCEDFLAAHPGPGVLDGAVDAALLSLAPTGPVPALDARGYARLGLGRAARPRRRAAYAAAAALAVAGLALVVRPTPDAGEQGVKGGAHEVVELQGVRRAPDGTLAPLGPGADVPANGAVLFRARSPRAGSALLMIQRGDAAPELLHTAQVGVGLEDLRSEGGALGLSLEGERGTVVVWLVVGDARTAPSLDAARAAVHSAATNALAVGRFELHVTP